MIGLAKNIGEVVNNWNKPMQKLYLRTFIVYRVCKRTYVLMIQQKKCTKWMGLVG